MLNIEFHEDRWKDSTAIWIFFKFIYVYPVSIFKIIDETN